jgi:hypothetical protein
MFCTFTGEKIECVGSMDTDGEAEHVCRNIKPLFNLEPPATPDEIRDAATQFVRKISGYRVPSRANELAFETVIDEIAAATERLLAMLETTAPPRSREYLAAQARARSARRYSPEPRRQAG